MWSIDVDVSCRKPHAIPGPTSAIGVTAPSLIMTFYNHLQASDNNHLFFCERTARHAKFIPSCNDSCSWVYCGPDQSIVMRIVKNLVGKFKGYEVAKKQTNTPYVVDGWDMSCVLNLYR